MMKRSLMTRQRVKSYMALGFNENQAQLLALGQAGLPVDEVKEEILAEAELIAEETKDFIPFHETLNDFSNEKVYNVKDSNSSISKNPLYKNPKIGRMLIDKDTGHRKMVHLDD